MISNLTVVVHPLSAAGKKRNQFQTGLYYTTKNIIRKYDNIEIVIAILVKWKISEWIFTRIRPIHVEVTLETSHLTSSSNSGFFVTILFLV